MDIALAAPILALAGTLAVAVLGFYQWRKQNANPNRAVNAAAQRAACEELWQRLEEINLMLRKGGDANPALNTQIREVNTLFISKSLYFDDKDQEVIIEYISALNFLREKVYASGDKNIMDEYANTTSNLAKYSVPSPEIAAAFERVDELRKTIKKKIQRVAASV
jgi:hypothetical protein